MKNDLVAFTYVALFFVSPLGAIYILLRSLDWTPRKRSLFQESFLAYVGWLGAFFVWPVLVFVIGTLFYDFCVFPNAGRWPWLVRNYWTIGLLVIVAGEIIFPAAAIAVMLLGGIKNPMSPVLERPSARSKRTVWSTAFLVSILTTALLVGALFALVDVDRRYLRGSQESTGRFSERPGYFG